MSLLSGSGFLPACSSADSLCPCTFCCDNQHRLSCPFPRQGRAVIFTGSTAAGLFSFWGRAERSLEHRMQALGHLEKYHRHLLQEQWTTLTRYWNVPDQPQAAYPSSDYTACQEFPAGHSHLALEGYPTRAGAPLHPGDALSMHYYIGTKRDKIIAIIK